MARRRAFTLVEILISISILSLVLVVSVNIFITNFRTSQQSAIENALLEDARFILQRLTTLIQNNQIDYEEYYSNLVVQNGIDPENKQYGRYHGLYAWQFFDGGYDRGEDEDIAAQLDGMGTLCRSTADPSIYLRTPDPQCGDDPVILSFSIDENERQHPIPRIVAENGYSDQDIANISSVCDPIYKSPNLDATTITGLDCTEVRLDDHYSQSELYLISPQADRKYIIKPKLVYENPNQFALSMVELTTPVADPTSQTETYQCAPEYVCPELDNGLGELLRTPTYTNDRALFEDFLPISPLRTNIKDIKFIIAPLENPLLAGGEDASEVRMQPQVTILLTVEPIAQIQSIFDRQDLELQLQTTVTSRLEE